MSANWKNSFLNKEKLNVQQQIDKDFYLLEIKLDAELVIEKMFLITIFLIFICVIYRIA